MNTNQNGIILYSENKKPFKKTKRLFLVIDIIAIIGLSLILLAPNYIGEHYLDKAGLQVAYTDIDKQSIVDSISDEMYVDTIEHKRSDNYYEEEIMNYDSSKPYKLFELTIDDYRAYMLVVYNPANVKLITGSGFDTPNNTGKMNMADMVAKSGAIAGINGGRFFDNGEYATDKPVGYVIKDGEIIWNEPGRVGNLIGFDNDNKLRLVQTTGEEAINMGIRDAVEFGPYLMVDGYTTNEAERMANTKAARVIIAQRSDGIVLMLSTDGGSFDGPRMEYVINTLKYYGAINAANLDGGVSSQMVVEGKNYTTVVDKEGNVITRGRTVINGFGVFDN